MSLPLEEELWYASHDEQLHRIPGFTARNKIKYTTNGDLRTITAVKLTDPAIGAFICKYGKATGYGCGYLDNDGFCATWIPGWGGAACTYQMLRRDNVNLADVGDSGGPIFLNNTAYGLVSGQTWNIRDFCECNLVYVQIEYPMSGINVSVLTN